MLFKIISIVGSLTFVSRILGFLRDLLIARVIGAGMVSDCFFVAFKLPNLFRRIFGEGAMNSAFIPVVSGISQNKTQRNTDIFFSKIFSMLLIFLLSVVLIAEIFMPLLINILAPGFYSNPDKFMLSINLSRLSFPFVLFVCLTSLMGAYLNTLGKFASMAITPIILNVSLIFTLLIFFRVEDQIVISSYLSLSISLAGSVQVIWMYFNLRKNGSILLLELSPKKLFIKNKETSKFFKLLLPAVIGNGAYQLNLLIDMILASILPDGSISYLYYADRVNQLPLGVLGIAISTALLPLLSKQVKTNEKAKANTSISRSIKFGILFSIPSFIGLVILSDEIITLLFFRGAFQLNDVQQTGSALSALAFGLPAFIMIKVLVVPFFANEDTKTPIKISLICMLINFILNLILIREYQHIGLAISTSIAAWINVVLLVYVLKNRLKYKLDSSILIVFFKVIISSLMMAISVLKILEFGIIYFRNYVFFDDDFILIMSIISGIIVYVFSIFILGIKEFKTDIWKIKKKTPN